MSNWRIGALARRAGCTVATVRFYEGRGLMPEPQRQAGGQRVYGRSDLSRLNFIRRCRDLDISLDRIADLLRLDRGGRPCEETLAFFRAQKTLIAERIAALKALDISLTAYVGQCETSCLDGDGPCEVYESFA